MRTLTALCVFAFAPAAVAAPTVAVLATSPQGEAAAHDVHVALTEAAVDVKPEVLSRAAVDDASALGLVCAGIDIGCQSRIGVLAGVDELILVDTSHELRLVRVDVRGAVVLRESTVAEDVPLAEAARALYAVEPPLPAVIVEEPRVVAPLAPPPERHPPSPTRDALLDDAVPANAQSAPLVAYAVLAVGGAIAIVGLLAAGGAAIAAGYGESVVWTRGGDGGFAHGGDERATWLEFSRALWVGSAAGASVGLVGGVVVGAGGALLLLE